MTHFEDTGFNNSRKVSFLLLDLTEDDKLMVMKKVDAEIILSIYFYFMLVVYIIFCDICFLFTSDVTGNLVV